MQEAAQALNVSPIQATCKRHNGGITLSVTVEGMNRENFDGTITFEPDEDWYRINCQYQIDDTSPSTTYDLNRIDAGTVEAEIRQFVDIFLGRFKHTARVMRDLGYSGG